MATANGQLVPEEVALGDLYFDDQNPRLSADDLGSQEAIVRALWREYSVDELVQSLAANGFFRHEPLLATEEDGRLVVVEGNRRLAALKLLTDPEIAERVGATQLPGISDERRAELLIVPVLRRSRAELWQFVGYKHVNGPQEWGSFAKAQYIEEVHRTYGVSLDEIANIIGDKNLTVRRLYRAAAVLRQAEEHDIWRVEDRSGGKRFAFSHLYTGLNLSGIRGYLGIEDDTPADASSPIPEDHHPQLGKILTWLYGSQAQNEEPRLRSQNPDLRRLDAIVRDELAVVALDTGREISVAYDISLGDAKIFRDSLVEGKASLQRARGTVETGYDGNATDRELANEVSRIARALRDDVERWGTQTDNE